MVFKKNVVFVLSEVLFYLTNSVDPDEMPHYVVFYQSLHCL